MELGYQFHFFRRELQGGRSLAVEISIHEDFSTKLVEFRLFQLGFYEVSLLQFHELPSKCKLSLQPLEILYEIFLRNARDFYNFEILQRFISGRGIFGQVLNCGVYRGRRGI